MNRYEIQPEPQTIESYCFGRLIRLSPMNIWFIDGEQVGEDEARGFMEACEEAPG